MNATRDADMATPFRLSVHLSMTLILWSIRHHWNSFTARYTKFWLF